MIGRTVSHYRITEEINRGSMGVVYRAEDLRLKRFITIKFPDERYTADPLALERFKREARAASSLNHPNICTIHDVDEFEGRPYIAMEYVDGVTLKELAAKEPVRLDRFFELGLQIAEGLEEAHLHGIIHRDIKPANIMVARTGHAKILDFGLAKLTETFDRMSEPTVSTIEDLGTADGAVVGTYAYMSPEQALGRELDHRSDLFSLGVVLYELACGTAPFRGATLAAFCADLINNDPRPVGEQNPTLHSEFDAFFLKALQKDPKDRFQTAGELKEELNRLREADLNRRPRSRWLNLPRIAVVSLVVILLILIPGVRERLLWIFGVATLPTEKHLTVLPFQIVGDEDDERRAFCEGLAHRITHQLGALEGFEGKLQIVPYEDVLDQKVDSTLEARKVFNVNLVIQAVAIYEGQKIELMVTLVDAERQRQLRTDTIEGDVEKKQLMTDRALRRLIDWLSITLAPEDYDQVLAAGKAESQTAYQYYLEGRGYLLQDYDPANLDRAEDSLLQALEIEPDYALAHTALCQTYVLKFDRMWGAEWLQFAADECQQGIELGPDLPEAYVALGRVHSATGDYEVALEDFQKALSLNETHSEAYLQMARTLALLGRTEEAEKAFETAIQMRPLYWQNYYRFAQFYLDRSRYEEALHAWERFNEMVPDSPVALNGIGATYTKQGDWEEGERWIRRSIESAPTDRAYNNLAFGYYFERRYREAAEAFERALSIYDKDYAIWGGAGSAYRELGQYEKSRVYYEEAAARVEEFVRANPRNPWYKSDLGDYLIQIGEVERGFQLVEEALQMASAADVPGFMALAGKLHEQVGNRATAIGLLINALEQGYSRSELESSPLLENLIQDAEYRRRADALQVPDQ